MNQPYKNVVMSLFATVVSVFLVVGCNQKTEETQTEMTPAEAPREMQKFLRLAGVMSAEGANVSQEELQVNYDAVKEGLEASDLKESRPELTIEVFISKTSESGEGHAVLKVHSETKEAMVAEVLLDFSSPAELAEKITNYLKEI